MTEINIASTAVSLSRSNDVISSEENAQYATNIASVLGYQGNSAEFASLITGMTSSQALSFIEGKINEARENGSEETPDWSATSLEDEAAAIVEENRLDGLEEDTDTDSDVLT